MDQDSDEIPHGTPPLSAGKKLMAKADDGKPKRSFGDKAATALDKAYSKFSPSAEAATRKTEMKPLQTGPASGESFYGKTVPLKPLSEGPASGESFYDSPDVDLSEGSPNRGKTGRGLGESMQEAAPPPGESMQPPGPAPGVYKADGDPYTYEAAEDGSIWIADGPSGRGMQVKPGTAAHKAIAGQIASGILTNTTPTPDLGESPRE